MAKLTKEQNPYGVTCRSVWEAKQANRHGRTFTVKKIVDDAGEYFAECLYNESGKQSRINLRNFRKYQRVL
jgi:predicted metal-dependent HD superfamily phosphohydrolase